MQFPFLNVWALLRRPTLSMHPSSKPSVIEFDRWSGSLARRLKVRTMVFVDNKGAMNREQVRKLDEQCIVTENSETMTVRRCDRYISHLPHESYVCFTTHQSTITRDILGT